MCQEDSAVRLRARSDQIRMYLRPLVMLVKTTRPPSSVSQKAPGCAHYRYRQRAGGLPEFVVQCTVDKANWVTYFVWPLAAARFVACPLRCVRRRTDRTRRQG